MTLYTALVEKGFPNTLARMFFYALLVLFALPSVGDLYLPEPSRTTVLLLIAILFSPELKRFMYYNVFTYGRGYPQHMNDYRSIPFVLKTSMFWFVIVPGAFLETLVFRGTVYRLALGYFANFGALLIAALAFGIWSVFIAGGQKFRDERHRTESLLDRSFSGLFYVLVYAISGNLMLSFVAQVFVNTVIAANSVRWKEIHLVKHKGWIMVALAKPGVLLYASQPPRLNGNVSFNPQDELYAVGFSPEDALKVAEAAMETFGYRMAVRRIGW